jgi:hypothetical protein
MGGGPVKALKAAFIYTFSFIFMVAACFFAWAIGSMFTNHYQARGWVETPAIILDSDLHTTRSGGVGIRSRPTYNSKVTASYSYVFNGREYTGSRVDFSIGADNFGDARRSIQMERLRSGSSTVFVNPYNPAESVFDRSLPGSQTAFFLFFLLFPCGLGTAWIFGLLFRGLSMAGATWTDRFLLPALGLFHGAPALYPAIFATDAFGIVGWIVLALFLALFSYSIWEVFRRIRDPAIGVPAESGGGAGFPG